MDKKNVTEVVIDGSIYKLAGYESPEYIQQVAAYLNNKITEMRTLDGFSHLPTSQKALMLQLNAADDYFKAKKSADQLEKELGEKDKELYTVKHELVSLQVKQEEAKRTVSTLRQEIEEYQKKIMELPAQSGQDVSMASAVQDTAEEEDGQLIFAPDRNPQKAAQQKEEMAEEPENTESAEEPAEPGDVFRPDKVMEQPEKEESSGKDDEKESPEEKSQKTFIPDASGREAMMRNARENFLAAKNYSKKGHRRH